MNTNQYNEIIRGLSAIISNQKIMAKEQEKQHKELMAELKEIKELLKDAGAKGTPR